uniref:Uncharacterized protein n=1 Tax=viral metagenome TaxID=1070528 RepID=A0A6C0HN21_9ZZZZ
MDKSRSVTSTPTLHIEDPWITSPNKRLQNGTNSPRSSHFKDNLLTKEIVIDLVNQHPKLKFKKQKLANRKFLYSTQLELSQDNQNQQNQQNQRQQNQQNQRQHHQQHHHQQHQHQQLIRCIQINNIIYFIDADKLLVLEPSTILINYDTNEYSTKYNSYKDTLEYLEPVKFFSIINDYIKGYTLHKLLEHFHLQNDGKLQKNISILIETATRLKLFNLVTQIAALYPIIAIDDKEYMISFIKLKELEPYTNLLKLINQHQHQHQDYNNIRLLRDGEIFSTIVFPYIMGYSTRCEIIQKIHEFELHTVMYNKICDDIRFYNLVELWKGIKINKLHASTV